MMHHRRSLHHRHPRVHRPFAPVRPLPLSEATVGEYPAAMRALTLIYHEDMEVDITVIIEQKMPVARYTKIRDVIGARTEAIREMDYTSDGRNNLLIIVATEEIILELAQALRALRQRKGHGLRGYITPVEGLI